MSVSIKDFVGLVRTLKPLLPKYTKECLEAIQKCHEVAATIPDLSDISATPKEIQSLIDVLKSVSSGISTFRDYCSEFEPLINFSTEEESIKDLEVIKSDVDELNLDPFNISINFKRKIKIYDPETDTEFDFGSFKFGMRPKGVVFVAAGNNNKRGDAYHPYMQGSDVCLGEYKTAYLQFMKTMNYHAAYSALISCLTVYGGNSIIGGAESPYQMLSLWIGQVCSVCDTATPNENLSVTGNGDVICNKCVDSGICTDEYNSDDIFHPAKLKKCGECNKTTSTVIKGTCLSCRQARLTKV